MRLQELLSNRRARWLAAALLALAVLVSVFLLLRPAPPPGVLPAGRLLVDALDIPGTTTVTQRWLNLADGTRARGDFRTEDGVRIGSVHQVTLSADGSTIAFSGNIDGDVRIYTAPADSATARAASSGPRDSQPSLAPDGSEVVFVRSVSPRSALFAADARTGAERQLTPFQNDLEPDWSPDGARIVFTTSRDGFQELYTMDPDGGSLLRLTNNELQNDLRASWSPDGTQIAYMTNYSVGDGTAEIWVMDADGANPRRLTDNDADDWVPSWSPDGTWITFTRSYRLPEGKGRSELLAYNLAAGREYLIRGGPGYNYAEMWSPDSAWLAFTGTDEDPNARTLYLTRPDGSDLHPLTVERLTLTGAALWLR